MSNYKVIIAEKPSVAAAIAKTVGAKEQHRKGPTGYVEGNGYRVTWAFGHLVGLKSPEQMGFTSGEVPMFPETWETRVLGRRGSDGKETNDPMVDAQMDVIEKLFNGAGSIIVATDAGREGELIFRYIYEYNCCKTPFERLWISSLTEEAIRSGMNDIRPGREFDALSDAAHARSEADWLVGFNASRALRIATGFKGKLSLGRVQTPTMGLICKRYLQNKNFVPTPYWQIAVDTERNSVAFQVETEEHYTTEDAANADLLKTKAARQLRVEKVEKKHVSTRPPLLFDLTELQRTANSKYGMTADQTLKLTQALYEKKIVTYPRTSSRYIPEDVFKTIPGLLRKLEDNPDYGNHAQSLSGKKLCRRSVDDSKVTDHHALLPTGIAPTDITSQEKKVYDLIATRMIEAFGQNAEADVTNVTLSAGGVQYKAHGSIMTFAGWKAVHGKEAAAEKGEDGDDDALLPELKEGDLVPINDAEVVRKTDKPLPIFTDSSLLGEMKTCGKNIEDEEVREAMKDVGLGTAATRAAIIEALINRDYVRRESKKLIPTELGLQVWELVKDRKISDVQTTGEWERDLAYVERGQQTKASFIKRIKAYVEELVRDLMENCKPLDGFSAGGEPIRTCPICGKPMKNLKYSISCLPQPDGCGFKIGREISGKKLPESAINALAAGKQTSLIKGFTSKAGKKFDARLKVDMTEQEEGGVMKKAGVLKFVFDEVSGESLPAFNCPCCGKEMKASGPKLECDCGFTFWIKQGGVVLKEKQIRDILAGKKTAVYGMTSKEGKRYDAYLLFNKQEKKLDREFINKKFKK